MPRVSAQTQAALAEAAAEAATVAVAGAVSGPLAPIAAEAAGEVAREAVPAAIDAVASYLPMWTMKLRSVEEAIVARVLRLFHDGQHQRADLAVTQPDGTETEIHGVRVAKPGEVLTVPHATIP